jgi:hypothetical protein
MADPMTHEPPHIGTLSERSLHAALKALYAQPGDLLEYRLGGYVIDIVRGLSFEDTAQINDQPQLCIEIQTANFSNAKRKLAALVEICPVRLVYPIPYERVVVRVEDGGEIVSRRKAPKRGTVLDVFPELVSFPALITHPHFSLDVLLIREEVIWHNDGKGSWRRKRWSIADRRLVEIVSRHTFEFAADFAALLPQLPAEFDTGELAKALRVQRQRAGKIAYCLRAMRVIEACGKRKNAFLYRRLL